MHFWKTLYLLSLKYASRYYYPVLYTVGFIELLFLLHSHQKSWVLDRDSSLVHFEPKMYVYFKAKINIFLS